MGKRGAAGEKSAKGKGERAGSGQVPSPPCAQPLLSTPGCKISNSPHAFPFGCDVGRRVRGVCPAPGQDVAPPLPCTTPGTTRSRNPAQNTACRALGRPQPRSLREPPRATRALQLPARSPQHPWGSAVTHTRW